jgi:hypothetical protein
MASEASITERCLVCGRELPRGGFSARVAGVFLSPLCVECQRLCSTNPDLVVAQYPQLFERSEIPTPHIHPPPSTMPPRPSVQSDRPTIPAHAGPQQVVVIDIHMPFGSMVGFMVKWAIASIPALIILMLLGAVVTFVFRAILFGMLSPLFSR